MGKSVDPVHASWTTASGRSMMDPHGGADGKSLENGRGGAPTCRCPPVAVGKGNGGVRNSPRGSPEFGERRSSGAMRVKWWRRWGSTGACSDVREKGREAVRGGELLRGGGALL
jgi:hypothetical protein